MSFLPDAAERLAAALLLCALLPLMLVTAAILALLSRRSPLIGHLRCGRFGEPFWTLKLRTMWPPGRLRRLQLIELVIDEVGPLRKGSSDERVPCGFARFCRRYAIDELPQLWNVMRGEMSLVGPRPLTRSELEQFYEGDLDEVLQVKPGLTGLWQVQGRSRLTYAERRRMDLHLVRHRGPRLYWNLLLRTVSVVFRGDDGC